jgi:hypothetical protein
MKLGLKDPVPGQIPLRFATYLDFRKLPEPPGDFGHYPLIGQGKWGDLGNRDYGDCGVAGACHQTMMFTAEGAAKTPARFTTETALANYSAISKFSLNDPSGKPYDVDNNPTDVGVGMKELADYWMNHGLVDADGKLHKIVAVCDMNPGDLRELWTAVMLFQCAGMGFDFPASAVDQTKQNMAWDVVPGATSAGGHYVPAFGRANGLGIGNSWGLIQPFTPLFYTTYNNQGLVAMSEEGMTNAKNIDGIDDALLRDDIKQLSRQGFWKRLL